MGWHTLAWTKSIATATFDDITPVTDGIFAVVNSHFMPPVDIDLVGATAYGTNLQRARLRSPRISQVSPVFIRPTQAGLIGANDANSALFTRRPFRLRGQEELIVEAIQNAGAAQQITVVGHVADRLVAGPPGDCYVIRATSTTAAIANAWSQIVYNLDNALPAGRYAVMLAEVISANCQAARLTFDGQYYRPGFPGLVADGNRLDSRYYEYEFGVAGFFNTITQPRIEVLCNGADASFTIYLHVIPTTPIPGPGSLAA